MSRAQRRQAWLSMPKKERWWWFCKSPDGAVYGRGDKLHDAIRAARRAAEGR